MLKRLLSIFVAIVLSINLFDGFESLKVTAESVDFGSISAVETTENECIEDEIDVEFPKAQTEYEENIIAEFIITGETNLTGAPDTIDNDKLHIVTSPGTDNFIFWTCIVCVKEGERYHMTAYKPYGFSDAYGMTIPQWFESYSDCFVIVVGDYNDWPVLVDSAYAKDYVKIEDGTLWVYSLTKVESDTSDTPADSETDRSEYEGIIHVDAINVADTEKNKVIVFDKSCDSLIDFRDVTNDTTILCQATDEENTFNIIRRLEPGERIGYSSGSLVSSWIIINVAGSERLAADAEGWNMAQLGATIVLHGVDLENDTITEDAYIGVIGLRNYENILYTIGNNEVSIKGYIGSEKNLVIPSVIDELPVTEVYDKAFLDCTVLESLVIPESVTAIGANICGGCVNLKKITMPFDKERRFGSFFGDNPTSNVNVPESLKEVVITGAGTIQSSCFSNCKYIERIEIIKLGSMGYSPFYGCNSLTELKLPFVGLRPGLEYSVDNTLDNLGDFKALKTIEITSMTYLCDETFASCDFLENVILHEGLETIGINTFKDCTGLKEIKIPSSVTTIKRGAFSGCSNLKVVYSDDLKSWCNIEFIAETSNPLQYAEAFYIGEKLLNKLNLPEDISELKPYVFYGYKGIESVVVHDSISSIGLSAFGGCTNISKMTIPFTGIAADSAESQTMDFFGYIFGAQCVEDNGKFVPEALETVTVTIDETIPDYAFDDCSGIKLLTLPDGAFVKTLNFQNCTNLFRINIFDSDEYFLCENGAAYSSDMKCIIRCFKSTVETGFRIPESVTKIDTYAFLNCTGLVNLFIPENVTYVGEYSFEGCTNLSKVYYADTELRWCDIDVQQNNDVLLNANFYFTCKIYFTDESGLSLNREKAFITGLDFSTNLSEFLSEFEFSDEMLVSGQNGAPLSEGDIVGTGCLVQRVVDGFAVEEAYVVLVGDADGDGVVTVSDAQIAYNHLMGTAPIAGAYAEAAKTTDNSSISILDIMAMLNMM